MPSLDENLEKALWKTLEELEFEHRPEYAAYLAKAERRLLEQLQARATARAPKDFV